MELINHSPYRITPSQAEIRIALLQFIKFFRRILLVCFIPLMASMEYIYCIPPSPLYSYRGTDVLLRCDNIIQLTLYPPGLQGFLPLGGKIGEKGRGQTF